jgi:hypothetical protein
MRDNDEASEVLIPIPLDRREGVGIHCAVGFRDRAKTEVMPQPLSIALSSFSFSVVSSFNVGRPVP